MSTTRLTATEQQNAMVPLWRTYGIINEWIRFADVKASALLTVDGVIFAAALSLLKDDTPAFFFKHSVVLGLAVVFGAFLIASAWASLGCIRPRVKNDIRAESIIFFEEIALHETLLQFEDVIKAKIQPEAAFTDIERQVWLVSKLASRKHKAILWSVRLLYAAIVSGIILLLAVGVTLSIEATTPATVGTTSLGATGGSK